MSPEFIEKWEHIIEDVDKQKIPVQFIKKLIIKLEGKKQQTINIQKLLQQGLDPDQVEDAVSRKLNELEDFLNCLEGVNDEDVRHYLLGRKEIIENKVKQIVGGENS